jgi:hypothetical protein
LDDHLAEAKSDLLDRSGAIDDPDQTARLVTNALAAFCRNAKVVSIAKPPSFAPVVAVSRPDWAD